MLATASASTAVRPPLAIAQAKWSALSLRARLGVVRRFRQRLAQQHAELCAALTADGERPMSETLAAEVLPLAAACRFLERRAQRIFRPRFEGSWRRWLGIASVSLVHRREPWGTVLVIAPSNYPLLLPTVQVLQALVAGNAVLLKPGREGGRVAKLVAQWLEEAGLPPHVLTVLGEDPDEAVHAIERGVDKVVLTGSATTGRAVLSQLANTLTPATMELSGCDAMYVLAGADVKRVASAIEFSLRLNRGATCMAPRRVFVDERIAAPLIAALRERVLALPSVVADEHLLERGRELLEEANEHGAEVVQSLAPPGRFAPALVIGDLSRLQLAREDIFLPLVAVQPFAKLADAVALGRECPYRLSASIFGDERSAPLLAAELDVGCVTINDVIAPTADPRLAFSGRGESGFGATRGSEGLLEMTQFKVIALRHGRWLPHLDPPHPSDAALLAAWLEFTNAPSIVARWRALMCLVRVIAGRSGQ